MGRAKTFKPTAYRVWRESMLKTMNPSDLVDCPDCKGDGVQACDECGHERDCGECDGDGKVRWEDLLDHEKERHIALSASAYVEALVKDALALASWLGRDPITYLVESGFSPYTTLHDKRLTIATVHLDLDR